MRCQMKGQIKELLSADVIHQRVRELGTQISKDYHGEDLTLVGVLKGSFIFMADLVRQISGSLRCDFLRISSYDSQGKSGSLRLEFDLIQPIEGQHVLLVEDILDTGKTLNYLLSHLRSKLPKSLHVCCLLDKGLSPELSHQVQYVGFHVPKSYVVGYGLDLDGKYRELPFIGEMQF